VWLTSTQHAAPQVVVVDVGVSGTYPWWDDRATEVCTHIMLFYTISREVKFSGPTWLRGQNIRPRPRSIRPRPHAMLASFSWRLSSCMASLLVIGIASVTLRSSLIGNCCLLYNILLKQLLNSALTLLWLPYWVWFLGIDKFYGGAQAFIYGVFITYATSRPPPHSSVASLSKITVTKYAIIVNCNRNQESCAIAKMTARCALYK